MKKIYLSLVWGLLALMMAGCYDEGGNNYDTQLPDVKIVIPETAYSGEVGQTIEIEPIVDSEISDDDLSFRWEVIGDRLSESGSQQFSQLVEDEQQVRNLRFTCQLSENLASLNKNYECRLLAVQKSTGRKFYSENHFTITITGVTGLMVLHGNNGQSDIGILQAEEFMPATSSITDAPNAQPSFYSENNGGKKLEGKGKTIVQSIYKYLSTEELRKRARIFVTTDKEVSWLNKDDLSYYGDWNAMFYLTGDEKVNASIPKGYVVMDGGAWLAFDGDEIYYMSPSGAYPYLFPEVKPTTKFGDRNTFTFEPTVINVDKRNIQCLMYANSVNGTEKKGFVGISTYITSGFYLYSALMDTKEDNVPFNPGDMKADLIKMCSDGNGECIAVMRGDASHPSFAGKLFLIDMMPNAQKLEGSATDYSGAPQFVYSLDRLTDINNAFAFEFGSTHNMCYYATPTGVYNYHVDNGMLYDAESLSMTDGTSIEFNGEVTMMKMLYSPGITTHNTMPVLLVATYNGSQATLYALHLDKMTGCAEKMVKYDAGNVSGWNFGRIYDVNIKGL